MKLETWMYKQALELYPRAYREQFGQPMLETYTDGLRAAKLEGEVWAFHRHMIVDTVKEIFKATKDVEKPDLLARGIAIVVFVYALYFLMAMVVPKYFQHTGIQMVFGFLHILIFIGGFLIARQRPYSEWIYFGAMSVGETLKFAVAAYLATFNWDGKYLPDFFYTMSSVQLGLSWGTFLVLPVAIFLRSQERKRLSRTIWYFAVSSIFTVGYFFIPAPPSLRTEFHVYDILHWIYLISKLTFLAILALKFAQRFVPQPRVIKVS